MAFGLVAIPLLAQEITARPGSRPAAPSGKGWDVAAGYAPERTLKFDVHSGTWMNLDVSPDGKELVFDLLGDLYLLPIAGGVFVLEAVSVLIQTTWFRFTRMRFGEGRRVFRMAPLHHHFEKMGWYESQVVTRFYILCVLFAVLALGTLKIR